MAIPLRGYLYDNEGNAVANATVDLLTLNTTTPVLSTTTTNASGYWAFSYATEGRYDVRITNGTDIRFLKYDDLAQMEAAEFATLYLRGSDDAFRYVVTPGAIAAERILNLPVLTATDTLAVLAFAQTFLTGVKTFNDGILAVRNPGDTYSYTLRSSAIAAARDMTLPALDANDTFIFAAFAQTLTNKRIDPRVTSTASSATPTPNADTTDVYILTALAAAATFGSPTGTPVQAQKLIIRVKDDATARALSWNAIYRAIGVTLPTTTTISKTLYVGFIYNSTDTKWDCVGKTEEA